MKILFNKMSPAQRVAVSRVLFELFENGKGYKQWKNIAAEDPNALLDLYNDFKEEHERNIRYSSKWESLCGLLNIGDYDE